MGFDSELIISKIDDELKCPICYRLLEDAVQGKNCDHIFCRSCINSWLLSSNKCPIDRETLLKSELKPAPKIITNLINRLEAKCTNTVNGCNVTLPLGLLNEHLQWCWFNLKNNTNESSFQMKASFNDLGLLRQMCNLGDDLKLINEQIKLLMGSVKENRERNLIIKQNIDQHKININDCYEKVRKLRRPFKKLLQIEQSSDDDDENDDEINFDNQNKNTRNQNIYLNLNEKIFQANFDQSKRKIIKINLKNLSSFTTVDILKEYLRQNDITIEEITEEKVITSGCKNFILKLDRNEYNKIFKPEMWPRGVTLTEIQSNKTVTGTRLSTHYPSVKISPGLTCWRLDYM